MSQESHRKYKELCKVKSIYYRFKLDGSGGIREDQYQEMLIKYKYDYIKKNLEYLEISKYEEIENEILWSVSGSIPYSELKEQVKEKLISNREIITLHRLLKIHKMKLLLIGYRRSLL